MRVSKQGLTDSCIIAFSGSLVAVGLVNIAAETQASNMSPQNHDADLPSNYGVEALADYAHFAPTHVAVEGQTVLREHTPGEPDLDLVRQIDGLMRWDTESSCDLNSRLYNFCHGKSSVFEFEVWLDNDESAPHAYAWAWNAYDYETNLPDTNYLDTSLLDPGRERSMTVGTLNAPSVEASTPYYTTIWATRSSYDGPNWFRVRASVGNNNVGGFSGNLVQPQLCMLEEQDSAVAIPFCYRYTLPGTWSWDGPWVKPDFNCRAPED